jgi:hypothetical protein
LLWLGPTHEMLLNVGYDIWQNDSQLNDTYLHDAVYNHFVE